jgi:hypothetical protein
MTNQRVVNVHMYRAHNEEEDVMQDRPARGASLIAHPHATMVWP